MPNDSIASYGVGSHYPTPSLLFPTEHHHSIAPLPNREIFGGREEWEGGREREEEGGRDGREREGEKDGERGRCKKRETKYGRGSEKCDR